MAENLGASFSIDVSDLKAGLAQANRLIRESNSEFKAAAAELDDFSQSQTGLEAKLKNLNRVYDVQKEVLKAYEKQYQEAGYAVDDMSAAAVDLRTKINNQKATVEKTKKEIEKYEDALDNLGESADDAGKDVKDLGDNADDAGGKLDKIKGVSKGVVGGIAAIGAACIAGVSAFFSLAESTREYREDMAKLQTGFQTAGFSAEQATETYKDLFSVLGEEDRSVEAVNHLAKLVDTEEELALWTGTILPGVLGTFGDSLPIEGLTEAANETAKVGKVTGPLADALNWAGVSEDAFNESLAACSSEQERAALITDTLNGLYSEAAENYKELNGDVMDAQRAQSELTDATATLGAVAEPIMTTLKLAAAELLAAITPFVQLFGEGLTDAFNGAADAEQKLADGLSGVLTTALDKIVEMIPTVLNVITTMIPAVLEAITKAIPQILDAVVAVCCSTLFLCS